MTYATCTSVTAAQAQALADAKAYTDTKLATELAAALTPAAIVDAVQSGIGTDAGAQAAVANAIADDLLTNPAFTSGLAGIAPALKTCAGTAMAAGANVPTCAEMNAAITTATSPAAIVDAVQAGIGTDTGAQAAVANAILDDLLANPAFASGLAGIAPALKTCAGTAMAAGENVPTCTEMTAAIAAAVSPAAIVDAVQSGIGTDAGAQDAIANAIADNLLANPAFVNGLANMAPALKTCAGTAMAAGATVPTCAEMAAAISSAVSAIPGDKFLQGLSSYDASTNTMKLLMSDNSIVNIDMTALLNDAVSAVATVPDATENTKGKIEIATTAETAAGTDTERAITAGGLASALNSPTANPMQTAVGNAVQAAIGSDAGATQAIVAAIAADSTSAAALAASVAANSPEVVDDALVQTNGTANGVAFLNASKVLTTGSALTFNGSQLNIPAGNAAAPSLSNPTDTNTGIFFPGADAIAFAVGGAESAQFDSSGNLLVGNSNVIDASFALLSYNGNAKNGLVFNDTATSGSTAFIRFRYNGSLIGSVSTNGSTTSYLTSSDYRLKENVQPMSGALEKVALLKPCTYSWKATGAVDQGFIAHELQEVFPAAVTGEKDAVNEDGSINPQGIDTSFLVATLTAAIQELNAKFEEYKATHP